MLFTDFDFSALDMPSYKEDAVREDIIAPILKKIGYSATGDARMERSKQLIHPFVKIGSKDYPIHIIPDYTLFWKETPLLVLEAKAPTEQIVKSRHVEQVFSYAIHPDIRAPYYGLCNGRQLTIHSMREWEPLLLIPLQEVDARWAEVEQALHPKYLVQPELKSFMADYGMTILKAGVDKNLLVFTYEHYWQDIVRVEDGLYTSSTTTMLDDIECLISFDYSETIFRSILERLPSDYAIVLQEGLRRQPYRVELGGKLIVTSSGRLGPITQGQYEQFVPIILDKISCVRYDPNVVLKRRE